MRVVLDACVLFPTVLREILIGCAERGLYEPVWSERILEEWARATTKLGPGAPDVARAEIASLTARWPRAAVAARTGDMARLWLPDPADVHVLATAIAASADTIVTFNAADFPRQILAEEGVARLDPDQFLRALRQDAPDEVAAVVGAVHATACRLSGEEMALRPLLKRARLPRLARMLG